MSQGTQVKADPKAILARRNGGNVVARDPIEIAKKRRELEKARQAAAWRREHGLDTK